MTAQGPSQTDQQSPAASVDLTPMKRAYEAALAALLAQWVAVKASWVTDLVKQVGTVIASGDLRGFAHLTLDSAHAANLIHDALTAAAAAAAGHVVAEAHAQGATDVQPETPPANDLGDQAAITAALLATALALSAGAEGRRVHNPGRPASATQADVRAHLQGLSDATPEQQLGGVLHIAMHLGRLATLRATDGVRLYASEVNDTNTCGPCREIDGKYLGTTGQDITAAETAYPTGGYVDCLGGIRCRGTVIGIWLKKDGE